MQAAEGAGHVAARADERRVGGRHVTGRWADAHEELNEALRTPAARRQAGGLREALHVAENVEADVEVREAALAQPREQRRLGALARCDRNDERAERPARRVQRPHVRLPRSCVADLCARELQERVQRGDAQVERLVAVAEHLLEQLDEPPVLGEQPRPKALGSAAGSTANARRARASARGRGSQQQLAGARPLEEERAAGLHRGEARDRLGSQGATSCRSESRSLTCARSDRTRRSRRRTRATPSPIYSATSAPRATKDCRRGRRRDALPTV